MQQRDGSLDHVAMRAQAAAVRGASTSDDRLDAGAPHQTSVLVVVIAAVCEQAVGPLAGPPDPPADRWDLLDQWDELGDVIAVAASQAEGGRDAVAVGDDVVFRARSCAVDRARPGFGPPLSARTCELSITALDQSSCPAACNSGSKA